MARPGVNYPEILLHFGLTREAIHCVSKKIWKIFIPVRGEWVSPGHRCHSPRRRGIQYAAPFPYPSPSRSTGSPALPGDDTGCAATPCPDKRLRASPCVPALAEKQDLPDPHLHRCRRGDEVRPLARFSLDRVDGV